MNKSLLFLKPFDSLLMKTFSHAQILHSWQCHLTYLVLYTLFPLGFIFGVMIHWGISGGGDNGVFWGEGGGLFCIYVFETMYRAVSLSVLSAQ